jgi:Domain of unknown function (DUF4365)
MPLPREHLLDELAIAYVQIVAAAAGAVISIGRRDYGVDGTLRSVLRRKDGSYFDSGISVDYQLKGTSFATVDGEMIWYDLRARNYDAIVTRPRTEAPFYFFLVCFPDDAARWINRAENALTLNASAFWWAQSGTPTNNVSSVRSKFQFGTG